MRIALPNNIQQLQAYTGCTVQQFMDHVGFDDIKDGLFVYSESWSQAFINLMSKGADVDIRGRYRDIRAGLKGISDSFQPGVEVRFVNIQDPENLSDAEWIAI